MKVIGALIGAVVCPLLVYFLVAALLPQAPMDDWTFAIIAMDAPFVGAAGIFGGWMAMDALEQDDRRRAVRILLIVLAFTLILPACAAFLFHGPGRSINLMKLLS